MSPAFKARTAAGALLKTAAWPSLLMPIIEETTSFSSTVLTSGLYVTCAKLWPAPADILRSCASFSASHDGPPKEPPAVLISGRGVVPTLWLAGVGASVGGVFLQPGMAKTTAAESAARETLLRMLSRFFCMIQPPLLSTENFQLPTAVVRSRNSLVRTAAPSTAAATPLCDSLLDRSSCYWSQSAPKHRDRSSPDGLERFCNASQEHL